MTTPIHLSRAKCGDRVLWHGEPFGVIHCWETGGCSVRLDEPFRVYLSLERDRYQTTKCLQVLVTDAMLDSGDFTIIREEV